MVNAVRQVGQNKVPEESDATPKAAFLSNCKLFDLEAVLIQSLPKSRSKRRTTVAEWPSEYRQPLCLGSFTANSNPPTESCPLLVSRG
jgi:hypothetical protein